MKIILILFVINLVNVVKIDTHKSNDGSNARTARSVDTEFMSHGILPEPIQEKSKRAPKPDGFECLTCRDVEEEHEPEPEKCDCEEPCSCDHTRIRTRAFTKIIPQKVTEKLLLRCTPESYYDKIVFDAVVDANLTCNGVLRGCHNNVKGIYFGVKTLPNGQEIVHSLNAKRFCQTFEFTNGNLILNERAILDDCKCKGDVLTTISQWIADDPIAGCRTCHGEDGVKSSNAVYYELKIFGKCCSVCHLVSGKVWFEKGIKNH